jgi:hypothetical protein
VTPAVGTSRRAAAYVVLVLVLAAWSAMNVTPAWDAPGYDLSALVVGAKVVRDGGFAHAYDHDREFYNRADSEAFRRAGQELGFSDVSTPFVHPPLLAVLARPLTSIPYRTVARGWLVAALLATLLGLWLGARFFAPSLRSPLAWSLVGAALVFFEPIRYALWLAQTTPFIFCLTMAALLLADRKRPITAGLLLAIAAFVKLTPAIFVFAWLWRRDYRAAAACLGGVVALAILSLAVAGIAPNLEYVARVREISAETVIAYNNHALAAFIERMAQPVNEIYRWKIFPLSATVRTATAGAAIAMTGLGFWAFKPLDATTRTRLACGVLALITLLVPSIGWTHYFMVLVPIGMMLWELAAKMAYPAFVRAALAAPLLLCSRPLLPDQINLSRGPVTILVGPTIAAAIVYVLLLVVARTSSRAPSS